jgi:dihydroorotate dehydrogenase (NAD+) catalytic subunit
VNTFLSLALDVENRTPVFNNTTAGLSGPAIRPIALRMVWDVVEAVHVPVIGMGGIASANDALEFLLAGSSAVQVGTATFADSNTMAGIITGITDYMKKHRMATLADISIRRHK